jgi:hypothetical protein
VTQFAKRLLVSRVLLANQAMTILSLKLLDQLFTLLVPVVAVVAGASNANYEASILVRSRILAAFRGGGVEPFRSAKHTSQTSSVRSKQSMDFAMRQSMNVK